MTDDHATAPRRRTLGAGGLSTRSDLIPADMLDLPRPPAWMSDAACAALDDPDATFFPGPGPGADKAAKAVCRGCGVRAACLAFSLERHIREGVWGGCSGYERRRMLDGAAS